ncbi:nucleotide-binding oligomerization domain-containing protein 2-like [Oculina patagonica]
MEGLKEFLTPTRFSLFGYVVVVLFLLSGVVFVGITGKLRLNERRTFLCDFHGTLPDKNFHQAQCFDKYEQQYNSPLPLYVFVILSFASVIVICLGYSWCCVKSRVDQLQAAITPDMENPRPRPRIKTRRVFFIYFLQLATRLVFGIVCTMLQNFVLYPERFPPGFACVLPSNATASSYSNCHNSVASEKTNCTTIVSIFNMVFVFLVFGEMVYLVARALRSRNFSFDSDFCSKYFFHQSSTHVTPAGFKKSLRKRILQETEFLEPLIHCSAEIEEGNMALDDIFLDAIIYTGRAKDAFLKDCERHVIYDLYLKPESQQGSVAIKTRGELFLSNKDAQNPRKILIVGRPGIGKSLLCQKLLRDWSQGDLFQDTVKRIKYAFLFRFRSFYSETSERISLRQMLNRAAYLEGHMDDHVFQELLDHPEKILLVFDGLDEFKDHERCTANEAARFGNSPAEEMPLSALYVKLLQGKLLPEATVLTSCRPTVLVSVEVSSFDRTVEIMGFTEGKVHKYVENFCHRDTAIATRIWEHINGNLNLFSLCYIPVNCRILCYFLKELIKTMGSESVTLPTRLTDVYQGALRLFIFRHHPEFRDKPFRGNERFSDSVEKTLTDLGSLARKGIAEGRLIFDSVEVAGMQNCGLLNQMPDSRVSPVEFKQRFCFIHLTLQEFLAAREIAKMDPDELKEFIASNAEDPKWHLVIQFIAGLLHGQQGEAVSSCFVRCLHDSLVSSSPNRKMAILMMKCLYEYNDDAAVKKAASQIQQNRCFHASFKLWNCHVTPVDCTAIVYFLRNIKQLEYSLDLSINSLGEVGCKELVKLLIERGPVKLKLQHNKITDQGLIALVGAMSSDKCNLKKLHLDFNDLITPDALILLCESLKNRHCKLTRMRLGGLQVTESVVSQLCESLEHVDCKLTDLKFNNEDTWTDTVLWRFCQTLKHPNCQLNLLRIECHKMTNQGVKYFCEALESEHCKLTKLELISNRITAVVMPYLLKSLSHKNCKLCKLNIVSWNINKQVKRNLDEALEASRLRRNTDFTCIN